MKLRIFFFTTIILFCSILTKAFEQTSYKQIEKIYLYANNSSYIENVTIALDRFNVKYEMIDTLSHDDKNLYIIFNVFNINKQSLPKFYISYQTLDLQNNPLTEDYLNKLAESVAVWDFKQQNIDRYRSRIFNYYLLPKNYEHTDPVILPCFLPISVLNVYKELLIHSNRDDTEISSLIPVLFFHSFVQNPRLIIEAGVQTGCSTQAFIKIMQLCNSNLVGIDIDPTNSARVYSKIKDAILLLINDLNFANYYITSPFKNTPLDIVFIDTSHQYEHTFAEIEHFIPLLAKNGMFMFHDSNVTPLIVNGRPAFWRINNTIQPAMVNPFGVAPAIKDYFSISFDVSKYVNTTFIKDGITWHLIHYPFCNGLAILKRI